MKVFPARPMPDPIEVLIADDHAMVRNGLQRIIDGEHGMHVAGQAADGAGVLALLEKTACHVLLLDVTMPAPNGPELVGMIRSRWPDLPILMVSMHNEPTIVRATMAAGANGYITKDSEPEELLRAIYMVVEGQRYVDQILIDSLISVATPRSREVLSPREREVMRRLATGQSNGEIAQALFLSEKTISTHKVNLMTKLGLNNMADLIRFVDHN